MEQSSALSPKQISVRDHDYSVRLIKIKKPLHHKKPAEVPPKYKITELYIEVRNSCMQIRSFIDFVTFLPFQFLTQPMISNVISVLAMDGRPPIQLSSNIPLEEICHSDEALALMSMS